MTGPTWVLVGLAGACALVDWIAVGRRSKILEYVSKPATLGLLIAAALALDPQQPGRRAWFVVALALSLAGDVFLMLRRERFVAGLVSFLLAHLAYIVGFQIGPGHLWLAAIAFVVIRLGTLVLNVRVANGAGAKDARLEGPVRAYSYVVTGTLAAAAGSGDGVAIGGAALFFLSDALIGWTRFVRPYEWAPVAIHATYHVGQALLVVSLAV